MVLQCFSDCTLIDDSGTRLIGPGEVVTFPLDEALMVLSEAYEHFKILDPVPLIPGVEVYWSLQEGLVQGPGRVELVEGHSPNRVLLVLNEGELVSIHERSLHDVNPWPAIDSKLKEMWPYWRIDREHPKVMAGREWLYQQFDDREPWM